MIRPLWAISLLATLAVNVLAYAYYPDTVNIFFFTDENGSFYMGKEAFFWFVSGVVLFINLLFNIMGRSFAGLPRSFIRVPRRKTWFSTRQTRKQLYLKLKEWVRGIALSVNLFIAALVANIYSINSDIPSNVGWIIWLSGLIFLLFVLLFFVFFLPGPSTEEQG